MADEKVCLDDLIKALDKDLSGEIREELLAKARGNQSKAIFLAKAEVAAKTRELRKLLNTQAQDEIREFFKLSLKNPADAIRAFVVASKTARAKSKLSIANHMEQTRNYIRAQFFNELRQNDLLEILGSGKFDNETRRAIGILDRQPKNAEALLEALPNEAIDIARIYIKHNESIRQALNRTGESIAKKPGYFGARSYDGPKMQADGKQNFTAKMMNWVDWEKVAPDLEPKARAELLGRFWEAKVHGRNMTFRSADGIIHYGPGKHSNATVFLLKDFDSELELQAAYGRGTTLYEQWDFEFHEKARTLGIQEKAGPNAEGNIDAVVKETVEELDKQGRGKDATNLAEEWDSIKAKEWRGITGDINIPVNSMAASVGGKVRTYNGTTSLGSALLSQLGDVAAHASTLKYYGAGGESNFPLMGVYRSLENGIGSFKNLDQADRDFASGAGIMLESFSYFPSRFDVDIREPGSQSRIVSTIFKAFGVQKWQDGMEFAAVRRASNTYAKLVDRSFDQLPTEIKRVLPQYGIGEREWDIWRKAGVLELEDGRFYLDSEKIKDLPDSDFKNNRERKDIGDKIRTLFYDIAKTATSKPDDAKKAWQVGGLRPGTVTGEAARFILQFKSVILNIAETHMGRFLYGYHPDKVSFSDAVRRLFQGHEGTGEMGRFLAASTLMGYLGMTLKDVAKGREPQIPDSPERATAVILQAMAEGGAAGLWGDYLFMQTESRFGAGPLDSLLGPTWSKASTGYDLLSSAMRGDPSAARALNFLLSNTPGQNLFYARTALDYLFLYRLQEMVNPGALRRRERRLEREKGQEYFYPPSQWVQ